MLIEKVVQAGIDFFNRQIDEQQMVQIFEEYMDLSDGEKEKNAVELVEKFSIVLNQCQERQSNLYYCYLSFLIYATKQEALVNQFLESCIFDNGISPRTKFFMYQYIKRLIFLGVIKGNKEISELSDQLYQGVLEKYEADVGKKYSYISREKRNEEFVLVLIGQILDVGHGPTKTLFDRCRVIKRVLKKKLYIINTAEMFPIQQEVPLFRIPVGAYIEKNYGGHNLCYEDDVYPFYQCSRNMPDVREIREILSLVDGKKPLCIIMIGGGSIVSDLCSKIVPTITISTVPSGSTQTRGQFQAIGREPNERELLWAKKHGMTQEHFIKSVFTSSFKKQEHTYTRQELQLPEGKFIVVLVGGRLGEEVDEDCLQMLLKLMEQGIYVAFMGKFAPFDKWKETNEVFKAYAINLGIQEDVLAVLECVDLYINPKRTGGGTSVAEALYKGVPVVTQAFGDGGLGAGENFQAPDYDEMYETVLRYKEDRDFYEEMSRMAKERAAVLTDSETEFVRVMETAMSREAFQ